MKMKDFSIKELKRVMRYFKYHYIPSAKKSLNKRQKAEFQENFPKCFSGGMPREYPGMDRID